MVVRPEAGEPVRGRLFKGLCGSKVDDMEAVLGKDRKGKTPLKWAGVLDRDDDIDIGDNTDMEDVLPPLMWRPLQEYVILLHSRTYYCLLFSLYHMFIIFVISY